MVHFKSISVWSLQNSEQNEKQKQQTQSKSKALSTFFEDIFVGYRKREKNSILHIRQIWCIVHFSNVETFV